MFDLFQLTCKVCIISIECNQRLHSINYTSCAANEMLTAHMENGTCTKNGTLYGIFNKTLAMTKGIKSRYPSSDYLKYVSLGVGKAGGLSDIGSLR